MLRTFLSCLRHGLILLFLGGIPLAAQAVEPRLLDAQVDALLLHGSAPPGVVFEVESWDPRSLYTLLPWVERQAVRLRERFPGLDMAVVTHGREQFTLMRSEAASHAPVHEAVRRLRAANVRVHVCGEHASWRGVTPEQFIADVDVAASGPAQINDYLRLDWALVVTDKMSLEQLMTLLPKAVGQP
ncbi:MAG: DsrE family protein [Pseudomonadota bacterium]